LRTDCSSVRPDGPSAAMADMEHLHGVAFDGEQDAIDMWLPTVQQLAQFNGRVWILRSELAPRGELRQGVDRLFEVYEPTFSGVPGLLRSEPLVYGRNVAFRLIG
jgi:hypothetical protein